MRNRNGDSRRTAPKTRFRNLPIKQKLVVVIVVTTAAALLLSGVGIVASGSVLFRGYIQRDLSALAQIIADNSTAALMFDDPEAARETLATLKAKPHLVSACVFRPNGAVFARYERAGAADSCDALKHGSAAYQSSSLTVTRGIFRLGQRLGTLTLLYDLEQINSVLKLYAGTVLGILLLASAISFALSSKLRGTITKPISTLAQAASSVAQTKDYSVRAEKQSGDELGILVDAFNEMLSGIQDRDGELRNALLNLQQSNDSLARSNEDLERFAFIASHDLQEPLRMITVYSQLLIRSYPAVLDEKADNYVERIVGGTRRMRDLLADLLSYTELGAGPAVGAEAVDLNAVFKMVAENLQMAINDSGAQVTAGPLPTLLARQSHFVSLFQNLIGNALKYRSEKPPLILISAQALGGQLRFTVADNGMGIAPEYHQKIFAAFRRLHGQRIPGTGIGLAICQRVVEKYGGRIWVESEPGNGARFIFTLPDIRTSGRGNSLD